MGHSYRSVSRPSRLSPPLQRTCPDNVPLCPDCPATPHLVDLDLPIERVGMGGTKVVGFGLFCI
jgi:hypothetical protein